MTVAEKSRLRRWAEKLSDEELEKEYYDVFLACLGSEAEEMYERGYDIIDCMEQERYEKDLIVQANMLEHMCLKRGIKLYQDM